jgi:hypothetical protein
MRFKKDFDEKRIIALHQKQRVGITHDICHRANREKIDETFGNAYIDSPGYPLYRWVSGRPMCQLS